VKIEFTFPGEPIPASRPRLSRWGAFTPKRYAEYKRAFAKALRGLAMLTGDLKLTMCFYRSNKRKVDIDNLMKATMDALQDAGVIENDAQIVDVIASKRVDRERPRVDFTLEAITEQSA